jgi:hypothetical protein
LRSQKVDRALPSWNPGIWIVTLLILFGGIALIVAMSGQGDRERRATMDRVAIGDPAEEVIALLGREPLRCPVDDLGHLRPSFPEGWPAAAVDVAIENLEAATTERWLFATGLETPEMCVPVQRNTEVGVDAGGLIVWTVAQLGRSPLRLPSDLTPAGVADGSDASP